MENSQRLIGYPRLAAMMNKTPGSAIFRRFGDLNIQNLLYLQSEISHLLEDYGDMAREDYESGDSPRKHFSTEWIKLASSSGSACKQWQQWLKIRSKLGQYSQTFHHDHKRLYLVAYVGCYRPRTDPNKPVVTVFSTS